MKVFLTGATGQIGSAVAARLHTAGHTVICLARSDEAAATVATRGYGVWRGDLTRPNEVATGIRETAADAVVHAAGATNTAGGQAGNVDRGAVDRAAVTVMLSALSSIDGDGRQRHFLYTSDQLIYGNTEVGIPADESTPLSPPPFLTWRPEVERLVLDAASDRIRPLVIRPVAVYGHGRDHLTPLLVRVARSAGVSYFVGDGTARWSTVHADDLADLYVRMLESAPAGTLLNAAADPPVTMQELAEAVRLLAGLGEGQIASLSVGDAEQVFGPFAAAFTHDLWVSAARARNLLGWEPRQPSLLDEARQRVPPSVTATDSGK